MQPPPASAPATLQYAPYPPFPPLPHPCPYPYPYQSVPAKPRVWTVFVAFIAALLALVGTLILFLIVLAGWVVIRNRDQPLSIPQVLAALSEALKRPEVLFLSVLPTSVSLLAIALLGGLLSPVPLSRRLALCRSRVSVIGYFLLPVGTLAAGAFGGAVVRILGIKPSGALLMLSELMRKLTPHQVALAIVFVAILPGICEELFFRGYVQTRLVKRWGPAVGIILASIMFGLMHLDLLQSPLTAIIGLYLGYVAYRAQSIWPPIICHIFNNSAAVFLGWKHGDDTETVRGAQILAAASAAVIVLCVLYIHFRVRQRTADNLAPIMQ